MQLFKMFLCECLQGSTTSFIWPVLCLMIKPRPLRLTFAILCQTKTAILEIWVSEKLPLPRHLCLTNKIEQYVTVSPSAGSILANIFKESNSSTAEPFTIISFNCLREYSTACRWKAGLNNQTASHEHNFIRPLGRNTSAKRQAD